MSADDVRALLTQTRTSAVVGCSPDRRRELLGVRERRGGRLLFRSEQAGAHVIELPRLGRS